jgi:TetR/AcrR family transcriptional regulator, mexJK operon transcriptional repressor
MTRSAERRLEPGPRRGRPSVAGSRLKMAEVLRVAREHFVEKGFRGATMDGIAAAAGVTKRTLYSWHGDKAALFRACVIEGAQRFPLPDIDPKAEVGTALRDYATALIRELARENSLGMGALYLREGRDFPELAAVVRQTQDEYVVQPLASYLRRHGLEQRGSTVRTELLAAMVMAPVHDCLLIGAPRPGPGAIDRHAALAVEIFLKGARD